MPITPSQRAAADANQLTAAQDSAPQVRLIAGPGTGKSGTIVKRIMHLLANGVDPAKLYAISFTRAACNELRERVVSACAGTPHEAAGGSIRISTMHSLALRIAKRAHLTFVGAHEPHLLDDWEQEKVYDREFSATLGCAPGRAAEIRLAHDARWQTLNPLEIATAAISAEEQSSFTSFHASRTNLYCCLLPGEVVYRCVEAFSLGHLTASSLPAIEHLIVDEYQDLNACDQEFVRLLSASGATLFVAGDDDQSIYSFRHANPEGIVNFPSTYPHSQTHVLTDCFRCTPAILSPSITLIGHNPNRVPKSLNPLYGSAAPPVAGSLNVWSFASAAAEAAAIATSCKELINAGFAGKEDQVVILLSNRRVQLKTITDALDTHAVAYSTPSSDSLTDSDGVRAEYCLLRVLADEVNDEPDYPAHRALLGLLTGVGPTTSKKIADACIGSNQNFHDLFRLPSPPSWLGSREASAVSRVGNVIAGIAGWTLADTLATRGPGIAALLAANVFTKGPSATKALAEWSTVAGALPSGMTLEELLQLLSASTDDERQGILDAVSQRVAASAAPQGPPPASAPPSAVPKKIRILTMHGAKGLSGEVVFIPSVEQGIMPSGRHLTATGLLIEARRLFYVSLTRAKACCIVTHAGSHGAPASFLLGQGSTAFMAPSQFLAEMAVPSVCRITGLTAAEAGQIAHYASLL